MDFPLTLEMLLQTFEQYHTSLAPWTWLIYTLAVVAVILAFRPSQTGSRLIAAILGIIWLWVGLAFFIASFAPVYPPAYLFGALFVAQGLAFLYAAGRESLRFGFAADVYGLTGLLLGLFGLIGYPLAGLAMGARFPQIAIVGAPCPAAILTFGLLLMTQARVPWPLLIIPCLWALSAVVPISVGMWPDIVLFAGGLVATAMIIYRDRQRAPADPGVSPAH